MNRLLLIGATAVLSACATAPTPPAAPVAPTTQPGAETYKIDPAHTFPSFEVSHFGYSTHRGRFNKTGGTLTLNRAERTGSVELVIESDSIDTGDPELEQRLREEDFFNSVTYPTITFKSTKFRFEGDTLTGVDGNLTLRGVTRPVALTVTSFRCGIRRILVLRQDACGANAETAINRADFGISAYPTMIGSEVKLLIQIEALKR